ncbi:MAG: flagellin [Planctomycetota bacterium]
MTRINSNIPSLIARANLGRANEELDLRLQRLSTGLRINRGSDDPAGLIVSERLRSDIEGVKQGIRNADRASNVIATTEGSLAEVNDLLNSVRALVVEAANTGAFSPEEIEANQAQIDSAIDSITRISNTATFGGLKLLNGSLDYTLSGVSASAISRTSVRGASFLNASSLDVQVDVVASAQKGSLYLSGTLGSADGSNFGVVASDTTLRVRGPDGVIELSFSSGVALADVVTGINNQASFTGVEAALINNDPTSGLVFRSTGFGTNEFVSVERVGGPADSATSWFQLVKFDDGAPFVEPTPFWADAAVNTNVTAAKRDAGQDVQALINGALGRGDGLNVSLDTPSLAVDMLLSEDLGTLAGAPGNVSTSYSITGGGALFQLGPEVTAQQQVNIGVQSIAASLLGGNLNNGQLEFLSSLKTGGANDLETSADRGNFAPTSQILENAIDEVSQVRGRLGAFERNVLQTNVRSLQASFENLSASVSSIRDADFAFETSELTRSQILTSSTTQILSLANQQSQQVLQLLG